MSFNTQQKAPINWDSSATAPNGYANFSGPYYASANSFSNFEGMMQNKTIPQETFQAEQRVLSDAETIDLFHNAMYAAREEQVPQGKERQEDALRVKMLTLDFKRAGIGSLPDEAVDIIKRDVAMIVLSHNFLTELPPGFADCTKVTYLNLRANGLEMFPPPLLKLHLLQILDLSRNKLEILPDEIRNMKALRVLSVSNNNLAALPHTLGNMESLKILKLSGNPLDEAIINLLKAEETAVSSGVPVAEHENDARITSQVKKFLRSEAAAMDSGGESSESPVDTPRPLKRNPSLRFPVNPASSSGSKSPGPPKPALPDKSHFRLASNLNVNSQMATSRLQGGSSSAAGSRPSGESITQAAQSSRSRRMGIVQKQPQLGSLEESGGNRNSFHLRGTSHNSALKEKQRQHSRNMSGAGSNSSADFDRSHGAFFQRLSSLPEQRMAVSPSSAAAEGAKSLLFSLHSLHPYMSSLLHLANAEGTKRSSLERVFYNSSNQLDALDQSLQAFTESSISDEQHRKQMDQNLRRACKTCLVAYAQVGRLLLKNAQHLVMNADPRYIRMLLILIYGSTIEAGNAFDILSSQDGQIARPRNIPFMGNSFKESMPKLSVPIVGTERIFANRKDRLDGGSANRGLAAEAHSQNEKSSSQPPSAVPPHINGTNRSSTRSSSRSNSVSVSNTSRTGDGLFMASTPAINTQEVPAQNEDSQDWIFEKVLRSFQKFVNETQQALSKVSADLDRRLERARNNNENKSRTDLWNRLALHAHATLKLCQDSSAELLAVSLNDAEIRSSQEFWQKIVKVGHSFADFCTQVKLATTAYRGEAVLNETHKAIKPCYRNFKIATGNLESSPWTYALTNGAGNFNQQLTVQTQWPGNVSNNLAPNKPNGHRRGGGGSGSSSSPYMPTTPLSAALGPAAAATQPSSSGTGSFDRSFQGDVFQRAAYALNSQHNAFRRN